MMQRKSKRKAWSFFLASIMIFSMVFQTLSVYAEEEEHTHTEACYMEKENLICSMIETEGHEHNEKCYCSGGEPICDLDESEEHIHGETCICIGGELICELEEIEEHIHGDECFVKEEQLICGQQEYGVMEVMSIAETVNQTETDITAYASSDVVYDHNFDSSVLPVSPASGANEWQIVSGSYAGPYNNSDVSISFDQMANVSYSRDDAVRLTKNVISTDVENEFLMYLNIEPQVSWEDILQLNTIKVCNANQSVSPPNYPTAGQVSVLSPEKKGQYTVPVRIQYYAIENGEKIILAITTMYANTSKVPNGAVGIGNPLLTPDGKGTYYANNNFNLKNNGSEGVSTAEVDISTVYSKYEFSRQKVYPKSVDDQVGEHLVIDESSFNYDGGSCTMQNENIINWKLPDKDLGLLPYKIDENGNVTPYGVLRKLDNGKSTYYRQEAYQLSYRFSLDVTDAGFRSCEKPESANDVSAPYAIQTNKSPDDVSNNAKGGTVHYVVGGDGRKGDFKSPYIKGLLYDVEFQKVLEGSRVPLEGVTFKIEDGGSNDTIAETDEEGWIKFHNLPWGTYTLTELSFISYDSEDPFQNKIQNDYMKEHGEKKIATIDVGEVINPNGLVDEHTGQHSVDRETDLYNQLYLVNGGLVENKPYRAKICIIKELRKYDEMPVALQETGYTIKTSNNTSDIYLKPSGDAIKLESFDKKEDIIKHGESVTYELIIPQNGAIIDLQEVVPRSVEQNIQFDTIEISKNTGSTEPGTVVMQEQGCKIQVLPGNDITITVRNLPLGTIRLKKVIDNYQKELEDDEFIICADSVNGNEIQTEYVLKHGEVSPNIKVTDTTTININEIVPKEYMFTGIEVNGEGNLNGNNVTVNPGENVVITVHNTYSGQPFFHVADAIKNIFKWE